VNLLGRESATLALRVGIMIDSHPTLLKRGVMIDHVYFLLDESKDRVRIGTTHNLLDRLFTHLNFAVGRRWKVLGVTEGGVAREKEIHACSLL
jgi:hypothetical protein